jgi:thiol-disulfide isomerase/thioredoxin
MAMKTLRGIILLSLCLVGVLATAAPVHSKGAAPLRIAHGEKVDLADFLVPGKTVIFDFTSEYCPPCRGYDGPLKLLHTKRPDLVVVQVDINRAGHRGIDWKSPVAQQYRLNSIPRFMVFGPDGKLLAEDHGMGGDNPAREMVDQWINRL